MLPNKQKDRMASLDHNLWAQTAQSCKAAARMLVSCDVMGSHHCPWVRAQVRSTGYRAGTGRRFPASGGGGQWLLLLGP